MKPGETRSKSTALQSLKDALHQATESGLLDEMAAVVHPDVIKRFCEVVADKVAASDAEITARAAADNTHTLLVFPLRGDDNGIWPEKLPVAAAIMTNTDMMAKILRVQASGKGDVIDLQPGKDIVLIEALAFEPDGTLACIPGKYDPWAESNIRVAMLDGVENLTEDDNNGCDPYESLCTLSPAAMNGSPRLFVGETDTQLALHILTPSMKSVRMQTYGHHLKTVLEACNAAITTTRADRDGVPIQTR